MQNHGETAVSQTSVQPTPAEVTGRRPLCVDLDGTLVKSDTLMDSLLVLARSHPGAALRPTMRSAQPFCAPRLPVSPVADTASSKPAAPGQRAVAMPMLW